MAIKGEGWWWVGGSIWLPSPISARARAYASGHRTAGGHGQLEPSRSVPYGRNQQGPDSTGIPASWWREKERRDSLVHWAFLVSSALLWAWISSLGAGSGQGWEIVPSGAQAHCSCSFDWGKRASWSQKYAHRCLFFLGFVLWKFLGIWDKLKVNCVFIVSDSKTVSLYIPEPAKLSLIQLKDGELAVWPIMRNSYQKCRLRVVFFLFWGCLPMLHHYSLLPWG